MAAVCEMNSKRTQYKYYTKYTLYEDIYRSILAFTPTLTALNKYVDNTADMPRRPN